MVDEKSEENYKKNQETENMLHKKYQNDEWTDRWIDRK